MLPDRNSLESVSIAVGPHIQPPALRLFELRVLVQQDATRRRKKQTQSKGDSPVM